MKQASAYCTLHGNSPQWSLKFQFFRKVAMHALFLLCQTDFKMFVISSFSKEPYRKKAASRKERVKQARMKVTRWGIKQKLC